METKPGKKDGIIILIYNLIQIIMKRTIPAICILSFLLSACMTEEQRFESAVRKSVKRQMEHYPQSTLKDIYKNFFQDEFGPGHIISDTTAAGNYLRREMNSYSTITGEVAEPLGWQGNFLRVNLSVIKEGIIPYDIFFEAFIESVNGIHPRTVPEWAEEWEKIEHIIYTMQLSLPGYETDKSEITDRLKRGEYVGHHSKVYEDTYHPHYRIISKKLYDKRLAPLLQSNDVID